MKLDLEERWRFRANFFPQCLVSWEAGTWWVAGGARGKLADDGGGNQESGLGRGKRPYWLETFGITYRQ